jgi:hypothetical protein
VVNISNPNASVNQNISSLDISGESSLTFTGANTINITGNVDINTSSSLSVSSPTNFTNANVTISGDGTSLLFPQPSHIITAAGSTFDISGKASVSIANITFTQDTENALIMSDNATVYFGGNANVTMPESIDINSGSQLSVTAPANFTNSTITASDYATKLIFPVSNHQKTFNNTIATITYPAVFDIQNTPFRIENGSTLYVFGNDRFCMLTPSRNQSRLKITNMSPNRFFVNNSRINIGENALFTATASHLNFENDATLSVSYYSYAYFQDQSFISLDASNIEVIYRSDVNVTNFSTFEMENNSTIQLS